MINLTEYLINESKDISLPFYFDLYPGGGKNKDFTITKRVLKNAILKLAEKDNEKFNPYSNSYILRCWIEDKSYYGKLPDLMPLIYRDRHNPTYEWDYNERESLWSRFFNLIIKKYGKVKMKLYYDDKAIRGSVGCLVLTIDDPRYEKDLEQHKKDEEAEKKAAEEAEKKRKELEKKGLYNNGDHVGSRRNVGEPGEAVMTQWGWYTGD